MSDMLGPFSGGTDPVCAYCGCRHNYSAEMCRDMVKNYKAVADAEMDHLAKKALTAVQANMPEYDEAIRADERRRIREGAVERVAVVLRDYGEWGWSTWTLDEYHARIVEAVVGKE